MTRLNLLLGFQTLSARFLVLIAFFVILGDVLIFSLLVARFRLTCLDNLLASVHFAILAPEETRCGKWSVGARP
jgi:fucose 4-O-acetylase-like acetyltransferase